MSKTLKHFVCAFTLCALTVSAQSERGSIRGTITDSSGGAISGAKIIATNAGTSVQTQAISTDAGNYNIPQLQPGEYIVTVERDGFKKLVRQNVTVAVSSILGLDLNLEVGTVTDSVTVSDVTPTVKSESTEVSTLVSTKSFVELPLNGSGGRQPEQLLYLTPGFTGDTFNAHINGSQTLSKEIQIDGMSTVTSEVQGDPRNLTFPPDALQEMSVVTSNYPAEYGNSGGGVERMVLKSGTNQFHGRAWEFLRNEKLDARGFFNANRSIHKENEYGFVAGGPVVLPKLYNGRNRTFFFTSFNWYKNRGGAQNSVASVPNDAFRNGDLSGLRNPDGSLLQIYDPATTRPDGAGGFTRDIFAGNIIPSNRISAISKNILNYVPKSATQDPFNNYPASGSTKADNRNMAFKADHLFSVNHRISSTYIQGETKDNGPVFVLPHPVQSSRDGNMWVKIARFNYDWTITPAILNSFRVGFNRQHQLLVAPEMSQNWSEQLGISGTTNGFPVVRFGPFTSLAENQDRIEPISNTFMFADSLSWTKGKHNLKFGFDLRKLQHQGIYPSRPPQFNFNPNETAYPQGDLKGKTGSAYASFLLGNVDNANMYINDVVAGARWTYFAAYLQDDFKITPKLTMNLGLRWDMYTPLAEVADRSSIMDPSAPNPRAGNLPGAYVFAGQNGLGSRLTTNSDTYMKAWGPRIGIAYRAAERMVIRTAYGISYSPGGGLSGGNVTQATDGFSGTANFQTSNQGVTPAFNWNGGFPQNFDKPPFLQPGLNVGGNANMWGDKAYIPMQRQDWNFGTQFQIERTLLDISYVGAKSTRLNTGAYNVNQVDPKYLALGNLLPKDITDPDVIAAGFRAPYSGFTGSLAQALRPFPQYLGVGIMNTANVGNSTYHSLQTKVERQFSSGLFLLSTYTWSKSITDANSALGGFFSPSARDNYNRSLEKALSVFDSPHRFVTAFTYELPIGPGKKIGNVGGVAGKVIGGWQVNGILTYASATPIQIGLNNTLPLFNSGNTPDSVPGVDPKMSNSNFDPNKDLYLNINAFAVPTAGKIGTSAIVLPHTRGFFNMNEDLGILKRTQITESFNVEFRFEMFNLFNRVIFAAPDANVSSSNFGRVTGQGNGQRNGQFALKLNF